MPAARHRNREEAVSRICKTMEAVINALGGPGKVAKLTGRKTNHLHNWQHDTGRFPSKTYPVMKAALEEKGYKALPELWGVTEP